MIFVLTRKCRGDCYKFIILPSVHSGLQQWPSAEKDHQASTIKKIGKENGHCHEKNQDYFFNRSFCSCLRGLSLFTEYPMWPET